MAHIFVFDSDVPVQQVNQLSLHEVDIFNVEQAIGVFGPVFVFGARVIVEFARQDQAAQQDSVSGARQALSILGQFVFQFLQVNEGSHQGTGVDICVLDQFCQKSH